MSSNLPLCDKFIPCIDCGDEFLYSAGEQAYFISKGLSEPKRCQPCRIQRKNSIVKPISLSPKDFNHD
jgi:hypothetical protein